MEYDVFLRTEVFDFLREQRPTERQLILAYLKTLRSEPFRRGDYTEPDASGRSIEVAVVAQYAVLFWADHPVKEIKVVEIRSADR